ncbi:MAG TPA: hypothetical protein VES70_34995, partial [Pseudomonas sp.]|nr:hypothetical protein [Pseudomonas sp.]
VPRHTGDSDSIEPCLNGVTHAASTLEQGTAASRLEYHYEASFSGARLTHAQYINAIKPTLDLIQNH